MNNEKKSKEKKDIVKDDNIHDYDSVLKESGVLTSVSGIIFGFFTKYFYKLTQGIYNRR